ncbi:MAG: DUF4199 domain-containing protein [Saprospiraceae bacterium]|nr:DUF4199 domain-containing protein [Saprospiraceae bacterium]
MGNPSVKNGLMGAGVAIIIYLILWLIDPTSYLKFGSWIGLVIALFFMYRAAKEARDLNGGFIEFAELFKVTFIMIVIMTAITSFFAYILFNFIDPNLIEVQKQIVTESIEKMSGMMGEDAAAAMAEKMEEQDYNLTIGKLLQGWAIGLVLWAIAAAIMSAIMKKKNPDFNEFA